MNLSSSSTFLSQTLATTDPVAQTETRLGWLRLLTAVVGREDALRIIAQLSRTEATAPASSHRSSN